jgi:hypothetical protein
MRKSLGLILGALIAVGSGCVTETKSSGGCGSDYDCKGDRICLKGNCIYPAITVEPDSGDVPEESARCAGGGNSSISPGGSGGSSRDSRNRLDASSGPAGSTGGTWDLAEDLLANVTSDSPTNPFSDAYGTAGVWHMMYSTGRDYDPATYWDIPNSVFVRDTCMLSCPEPKYTVPGYVLWDYICSSPGGNCGINTSSAPINHPPCASGQVLAPHKAFAHPGPNNTVMYAWKSPISAAVSITGGFSDIDCGAGDGIVWRVDKTSSDEDAPNKVFTLASGAFDNCGSATLPQNLQITVSTSDFIYFILDPKEDYIADLTQVDVTISRGAIKKESFTSPLREIWGHHTKLQ